MVASESQLTRVNHNHNTPMCSTKRLAAYSFCGLPERMTAVHDEEGLEAPVSNLPILTSGSNGHCRLRRRPHQMHEYHVLLGVTGSVATVKVPELAVCLCRELGGFGENGNGNNAVHIKIVLTMGASHFWEQARTYSDYWWKEMQQYVWNTNQASDDDIAKSTMENFGVSSRIEVIRKFHTTRAEQYFHG